MFEEPDYTKDKRRIFNAFFIPAIIGIFMILSFLLEKGMDLR